MRCQDCEDCDHRFIERFKVVLECGSAPNGKRMEGSLSTSGIQHPGDPWPRQMLFTLYPIRNEMSNVFHRLHKPLWTASIASALQASLDSRHLPPSFRREESDEEGKNASTITSTPANGNAATKTFFSIPLLHRDILPAPAPRWDVY